MSTSDSVETIVPDSEHRGLIERLPQLPRDLAQLARFDRPIGWWLLFWPCTFGLLLAGGEGEWQLLLWFLLVAAVLALRLRRVAERHRLAVRPPAVVSRRFDRDARRGLRL